MAARTELAVSAWRAVTHSWPRVVATWGLVDEFLRQHPELPATARRTLELGRARLVEAQRQRSPEARVRATLATVRRLADESAAASPDDGTLRTQAAAWRRGADRIEQALTLVGDQRGSARRRMLGRVVARADELAAEVFEQLVSGADDGQGPDAAPTRPSG